MINDPVTSNITERSCKMFLLANRQFNPRHCTVNSWTVNSSLWEACEWVCMFMQVCGEKNRFEKLMEYFRNDDINIDFMVRTYCIKCFICIYFHVLSDSYTHCTVFSSTKRMKEHDRHLYLGYTDLIYQSFLRTFPL